MRRKIYPDPIFARNLKRLLADMELTQGQMANLLDKDRKAVNAWVNCVSAPSVTELKKICIEYRISADELLGIEDIVK